MAKSLAVAFLLWGTLGLFGAHHFYLRRDRHGLVHLFTLGGLFIGWFWDAFRMRKYVRWSNFDAEFKEQYVEKIRTEEKPTDALVETLAGTFLSHNLWYFVRAAIPNDLIPEHLKWLIVPLMMAFVLAFAVYFLGNIGESHGSYWSALKGTILTLPYYFYSPDAATIWCLMVSKHTFGKTRKFRLKPEDYGGKLRRVGRITFHVGIFLLIASSYFYFNCTTQADEGEPEIRCIDSIRNFFASSGWKDFRNTMGMLYVYVRYHGFSSVWKEIFIAFDTSGEDKAAETLGVVKSATEDEIKAVYKKLARQYHPDRVKDPEERVIAQQKFMEITAAYELLSTTKAKRAKTNKKAPKEDQVKTEL